MISVRAASAGRRPGVGQGFSEGVLLSKIGSEYINRCHFVKLMGVERVRIDVGCLFSKIGIFFMIIEKMVKIRKFLNMNF